MPTEIEGVKIYTIAEVANLLEVNLQTIRNEINRGKINTYKFGLGVAITEKDLKAYLERRLEKKAQYKSRL